jgi:nucleotide-binding universal stress UspA family protein
MSIIVPFDGTPLSEAALRRAGELGAVLDQRVIAVTVIPRSNAGYARQRGWLEDGESFDLDQIVARLSKRVHTLVPEAEFEYEVAGRYAQSGEIASKIRRMAREAGTELVVLGSDNAGNIVTSVSSVAAPVAADEAYDVMIVRQSNDHNGQESGDSL